MGIYGGRIILLLIMICRKEGKGSYMLIFVRNFRSLSDNNLVQREKGILQWCSAYSTGSEKNYEC